MSAVIPGNSFPVTEDPYIGPKEQGKINSNGYYGKACKVGYQSHLTLVDESRANAFPLKGPLQGPLKGSLDGATTADELVIFTETQALPLFVFFDT